MMRLSRRGLGSSRCARDWKTPLSAALTSGRSGCWKPSPPSHQAAAPGCSSARSETEHPLSSARSKGSFPSCHGETTGKSAAICTTNTKTCHYCKRSDSAAPMRRMGAYVVLLREPLRVRVQQLCHLRQRRVAHRGDMQGQPSILRTAETL